MIQRKKIQAYIQKIKQNPIVVMGCMLVIVMLFSMKTCSMKGHGEASVNKVTSAIVAQRIQESKLFQKTREIKKGIVYFQTIESKGYEAYKEHVRKTYETSIKRSGLESHVLLIDIQKESPILHQMTIRMEGQGQWSQVVEWLYKLEADDTPNIVTSLDLGLKNEGRHVGFKVEIKRHLFDKGFR